MAEKSKSLGLNPLKWSETIAHNNDVVRQQQQEKELFELQKEQLRLENERIKLENEEKRALVEALRKQESIGGAEKLYGRVEPEVKKKKTFWQKFFTAKSIDEFFED